MSERPVKETEIIFIAIPLAIGKSRTAKAFVGLWNHSGHIT